MPTPLAGNEKTAAVPPEANEIEVSLFGPGYGECVVLHIGSGRWIIVDSCIDAISGRSQALLYLESIGVQPERDVVLILSSHWHDDHIRGLADTVETCRKARFVCSDAIQGKHFLTITELKKGLPPSRHGSGVDEFRRIFSILRNRGQSPMLASENKLLLTGSVKLWSLSPSAAASLNFREHIVEFLRTEAGIGQSISEPSENSASVVLWLETASRHVLLGGDLERGKDDDNGWRRILFLQERSLAKADVFKVPHHGAENACHPGVWTKMVTPEPIALLTPWELAGNFLPRKDDANRILRHSKEAYITACQPSVQRRLKRHPPVERMIRQFTRNFHQVVCRPGHVRVRWGSGDANQKPAVELFRGACHLRKYRTASGALH